MARKQTESIVLRSFDIGEQDKIIIFFAKDVGIFKGVAKGARKFGNRFGSSLEPMSHVNVFYYEKENRELVTVSNCDLIESFFDIQNDLDTSFTLSYFAELIEEFFPLRSKDDTLFRLLLTSLQSLKTGADLDLTSAYFEAWFLKLSGILPDFKKCKKCREAIVSVSWLSHNKDGVFCDRCVPQGKDEISPEINVILDWIRKNPPPKDGEQLFSPNHIAAIREVMQRILIFHMERKPKSLSLLSKNSEQKRVTNNKTKS
jgi:DNA repair protein RecO (recombination protein O)